ncbi:hypothetical protein L596_023762 [Steinernema carpocapsae]|uniref:Uncharacterized protein n=1 Tax=Steinernema carpocapsae TaxID=34508 RepID=A0A4U5MEV5_STECR|nr:hypothetical protein L596_023762 [Steinernema carpocapsae]
MSKKDNAHCKVGVSFETRRGFERVLWCFYRSDRYCLLLQTAAFACSSAAPRPSPPNHRFDLLVVGGRPNAPPPSASTSTLLSPNADQTRHQTSVSYLVCKGLTFQKIPEAAASRAPQVLQTRIRAQLQPLDLQYLGFGEYRIVIGFLAAASDLSAVAAWEERCAS